MTAKHELRPSIGPARLAGALRYSIAGFRHATRHEAAFQQEVLLFLLLLPAAVLLPVPTLDRLVIVLSMLLVIVVELLNSAIEATVDRISAERHPLAGAGQGHGQRGGLPRARDVGAVLGRDRRAGGRGVARLDRRGD